MNKREKKLAKRFCKKATFPVRNKHARRCWVDYNINERAAIQARIEAAKDERGVVAVVCGGMDCDCVSFVTVTHERPGSVFKELRDYERFMDQAEGPQYWRYERCADYPEYRKSRDLAAEAFEDGHPHDIHYTHLA